MQTSLAQGNSIGIKRSLDMHALWKFSVNNQLRLSINNLVNSDYETAMFSSLGYPEVSVSVPPTYTTCTLRWELKY